MHETLENSTSSSLALASPIPLIEHPAGVYLAALSPGSRPAMRQALNAIARLLTNDSCDAMTLNWAALRYKHTAAVRSVLSEKYAPAYVNKVLCALPAILILKINQRKFSYLNRELVSKHDFLTDNYHPTLEINRF